MTEREINEIKVLWLEIKRIDRAIKDLKGESTEYVATLEGLKEKLYKRKAQAETFISDIENAEIRLIFCLKFVDLKSWNYIARYMNYDRSTIYKKYKNYIRRIENEKQ